jgi:hypothetical protein
MSPPPAFPTPDFPMPPISAFAPPASFRDPREREDFRPSAWPLCGGTDAPAFAEADLHERRSLEFLAAYYDVNCRHEELHAARAGGATAEELAPELAAVEQALEAVDRLEDRYQAIGFYGEPAMEGVFYRSISFARPELPRILLQASSLSSHLAIPGLDEIPAAEFTGPTTITRWNHGKVDL